MNVNDVQEFVDKQFPKLKLQVSHGKFGPADFIIRFTMLNEFVFGDMNCRSARKISVIDQHRLVLELETKIHESIGMLCKALDDCYNFKVDTN